MLERGSLWRVWAEPAKGSDDPPGSLERQAEGELPKVPTILLDRRRWQWRESPVFFAAFADPLVDSIVARAGAALPGRVRRSIRDPP